MTGRLLHYSAQPLAGPLRSRTGELTVNMKPRGLWLSVEGEADWKSWCEAERFALDTLRCATEILLKPEANILRLSSAADIDQLTETYHKPLVAGYTGRFALDWPRIGETCDGIIIAPYQWSRRLGGNVPWYYGWDCASGCIWDPRAIAAIRPAQETG